MTQIKHLENIAGHVRLLSGRLCLDFCNTVEYRGTDHEVDLLVSFRALVQWSVHARSISQDEGAYLLRRPDSAQAEDMLQQAHTLRDDIYRLFSACAHGQEIPGEALEAFNAALRAALAHRQVRMTPLGLEWTWETQDTPEPMIWSIVYSAAELLTSSELERVRQCPGCGWLFLDESRNRNRTWCDMRICGNRAKARRHYRRQKSQQADPQDMA